MAGASHDGIFEDISDLSLISWDLSSPRTAPEVIENARSFSSIFNTDLRILPHILVEVVSIGNDLDGIINESFRDSHIYHRVWLSPDVVVAGMIAGEQRHIVGFWNSHVDGSISLDTVIGTGQLTGVTLEGLAELAEILLIGGEDSFTVVVSNTGDPVINGYVRFSFTGAESGYLDLVITGLRMVFIPVIHNWDQSFSITYKLNSDIFRSQYLHEQRSQLYQRMRRDATSSSWVRNSSYLRNILNVASRVVATGVFSEPMSLNMTGSLLGLSSLTINEDTTYYYNLRNLTLYLVLWNRTKERPTLINFSNIAGYTLTLTTPVPVDWNAEDCDIYPVITGGLQEFIMDEITSDAASMTVQVEEFIRGGLT